MSGYQAFLKKLEAYQAPTADEIHRIMLCHIAGLNRQLYKPEYHELYHERYRKVLEEYRKLLNTSDWSELHAINHDFRLAAWRRQQETEQPETSDQVNHLD